MMEFLICNEMYFVYFIQLLNSCPGWQPGIEGTAADWDEDWDKFEDEGTFFLNKILLIEKYF